ncbi:MAG: peroxidase-related enzyme [Bryobacteraceae bacterium]|nr:peroxidase-related enzyme [Bryobacteraceae bacterium]
MKPMYLPSVENNPNAEGAYADLIKAAQAAGKEVPQIWHLFAYKPAMTQHLEQLTQAVMRGPSPLSPGFRELIATLTSKRNQTPFCATTHAASTTELLGNRELVEAVLHDPRSAPVTPAEKALLLFVEKVNHEFWKIGEEDFEILRAAGWSDEAIYDAITVCALFNFYNRWVRSTGVSQMGEEGVRTSGERLARTGYLRTDAAATVA